ncbi:MAG: hypothetical protein ACYS8Z_05755 [Planctomycetota bacterium]|jgi:hypothetical protein
MECPECKRENHDHAEICFFCRNPLEYIPEVRPIKDARAKSDVRISRLAIASMVLAVVSIPGFIIFSGPAMYGYSSRTYSSLPISPSSIFALAFLVSAVSAVFLGLAALACIEMNYGRLTGRAYAAIGIAIPLIGCILGMVHAGMASMRGTGNTRGTVSMRGTARRVTCSKNLSGLGKSMLIYANDYNDKLPRAGGPNSQFGYTANWKGISAAEAYGLDDGQGQASMSANFFLLVKYAAVTPKSFLCDKDRGFAAFDPADYNADNRNIFDLWDFGPDPSRHVCFSYHTPYGSYGLTSSSDPGMAVAADRNPWLRSPGPWSSKVNFPAFDPNGPRGAIIHGNSMPHNKDGQNVLFIDAHVSFEKESFCGVNKDNIYTTHNGTDVKKGFLPSMTSQPANKYDSVLLHDPPKGARR